MMIDRCEVCVWLKNGESYFFENCDFSDIGSSLVARLPSGTIVTIPKENAMCWSIEPVTEGER